MPNEKIRASQTYLSTGKLVGRTTAGTGAGEEVTLDADGTLAANSDTVVATQKAVKTYANTKKPYHGVVARPVGATNPLPTTITTTTFTLGATANPISYYYQGTLVNVTSDKTTTLSGAAGLYFIYFNAATGNLLNSTVFPGVGYDDNVLLASVSWNGTNLGLVNDERHGYIRDTAWHIWAHNTVGTRYRSGITLTHNGGTGAAATFATTSGEIADEDIQFVIGASSSFPTANAGRIWYQTAASTYAFLTAPSTIPGYLGANNRPNVVNSTGYALTQVPSATNRYVNVFVYATTDLHTPIYFLTETVSNTIAGQGGYTSLANARAVGFPNISGMNISAEMKPIYRLIWRADGVLQAIDTTLDDYRTVSSLPQGAGVVSFNPAGNVAATNVQSAIEEVDAEKLPLAGGSMTGAINEAKGADIASATTTDIGAATGNFVDVTGTTTITGLGTVQSGTLRAVRFTGALTLTHNATSLILPTGANITTAAGDTANFRSLGSGNWVCTSYQRKDGTALASAAGGGFLERQIADYQGPSITGLLGSYTSTRTGTLGSIRLVADSLPVGTNCTAELRKNSPTSGNVLSATLQITTTESATNGQYIGTAVSSFSSTAIAAGDVFYVVLTYTGSSMTTPPANVRALLYTT
jgi:hypothetical protein